VHNHESFAPPKLLVLDAFLICPGKPVDTVVIDFPDSAAACDAKVLCVEAVDGTRVPALVLVTAPCIWFCEEAVTGTGAVIDDDIPVAAVVSVLTVLGTAVLVAASGAGGAFRQLPEYLPVKRTSSQACKDG
jgi:hypothetical protein